MDKRSIERIKKRVNGYLLETGMHVHNIRFSEILGTIREEMKKGLSGGESSLAMIPTYIETDKKIPPDTPVLVLDAGGTNFRTALVSFNSDGTPKITDYNKYPMPGSKYHVGRDDFFDSLAEKAVKLYDSSSSIGFCFSYPTDITPDKDGKLLHFSKEIMAPEVEGEYVGHRLKEALSRAGAVREPHIVVLNDTVATLLAAKAAGAHEHYGGYIGFILGTGLNCAYVEHNGNIGKISSLPPEKSQIINMESGGFSGLSGGAIDEEFDAGTNSPGRYRMEKMVSGAYLGPLGYTLLKRAAEDGLFSSEAGYRISDLSSVDTATMARFLHSPMEFSGGGIGGVFSEREDRLTAYLLLDNIVERAAKLAALNISAAVIQGGTGEDPTRPAAVCADGTTFYKTRRLKFNTEYYLKRELEEHNGYYLQLISLDKAPIIGAAVAGLTN
ncbi:MAG: hexokinase [Spirochaetia bacterium]